MFVQFFFSSFMYTNRNSRSHHLYPHKIECQCKIPIFLHNNIDDMDDTKREKCGPKLLELVPYFLYPIKHGFGQIWQHGNLAVLLVGRYHIATCYF